MRSRRIVLVLAATGLLSACLPPLEPPRTLSLDEYRMEMSGVGTVLTTAITALQNARSQRDVAGATNELWQRLHDGENRVRMLTVPDELVEANTALADALAQTAARIWDGPRKNEPATDACGNEAYWAALDREDVNAVLRPLEPQLKAMGDRGFPVTITVPPPAPPPAPLDRRNDNGHVLVRSGAKGPGTLTITNNQEFDAVVSVVDMQGNESRPQVMMYVQAGRQATITGFPGITGIPGAEGLYLVYFKSGRDWDESRRGFTLSCSFMLFSQPTAFTVTSSQAVVLNGTSSSPAATDIPAY
ncbi:hypothetical protein [Actinocrispum sp. NPDC049592]|uniref:hypothetical protein n=1 Tax=Actinocrispum sp. NPDC049592 TaxID=3154835 RepID=UPI00342F6852